MAQPVRAERPPADLAAFYPRIHRYVRGLVHDDAEAEDLAQEAFLRAHHRWHALRDQEAVLPWLYSIATRACLDRLRQRSRRARRESDVDAETVARPDPESAADLRVEQREMGACVQSYVEDLSDSHRAVLLLHDVHGLTCPEIADLLGDSPGAVKIRLHRARGRLRAALESGCAISSDERGAVVCDPKR